MNNKINTENLRNFLAVFIEENNLTVKQVAKAIGCSIATLERVLVGETLPTNNLIKQVGILIAIGYKKYIKLSESEKETISEKMGTVGAGGLVLHQLQQQLVH
jgi:transcriptional regulator with XRE-family HTH domain